MSEENKKLKPNEGDYEDATILVERDGNFKDEAEKKKLIEMKAWSLSGIDLTEEEKSDLVETTGPSEASREERDKYGIIPLHFFDFMKYFGEARYKVFVTLWAHVSWRESWCPVSIKDIAEDAGLKLDTTSEALKWLHQFGFWKKVDFAEPKDRRYDSAESGRRVFGARYKFRGPGKLADGRFAINWKKIHKFIEEEEAKEEKRKEVIKIDGLPKPLRRERSSMGRFVSAVKATADYVASLGGSN